MSEQNNRLVYALWAFGVVGAFVLLRDAWAGALGDRDFVAVWVAGKLAAAGHAAQAFDNLTLQAVAKRLLGTEPKIAYPYPPHALFVAVPLSYLPYRIAYWGWQAVSALLFYFAARPYCPPNFPKLLVVLTPAALINVLFGQVGLVFGALWLFAFSGSALAAAVLTFKPHLGALVAVDAAQRRKLMRTAAIAIGIMGLSLAAFGVEAWRAWLTGAAAHQAGDLFVKPFANWYFKMPTPYLGYGFVGWIVFGGAALFLLLRRFDVFTAATATFLIAPYGFHYDMTVVSLGFGLLLFLKWRELPAWQTFAVALGFLLPLLVGQGTWLGPPILLVGLFVQTQNPITKEGFCPLSLWRQQFGSHRLNS
jgi:hypothetical protein